MSNRRKPTAVPCTPSKTLKLSSVDAERRVYVYRLTTGGMTSISFESANAQLHIIRRWIGLPSISMSAASRVMGTHEHFDLWADAQRRGALYAEATDQKLTSFLSPQLLGLEGRRVRVMERPESAPRSFVVGVSRGWMPIHTEMGSPSDFGAPACARYHSVQVID